MRAFRPTRPVALCDSPCSISSVFQNLKITKKPARGHPEEEGRQSLMSIRSHFGGAPEEPPMNNAAAMYFPFPPQSRKGGEAGQEKEKRMPTFFQPNHRFPPAAAARLEPCAGALISAPADPPPISSSKGFLAQATRAEEGHLAVTKPVRAQEAGSSWSWKGDEASATHASRGCYTSA